AGMVTRKPDHQGELGESRKTIAQGMPECSAYLWWTYLRAFILCTRSYGCGKHPAFPAPSQFGRAMIWQKLGQIRPREREGLAV
ncbi:hypothetical protein, partial [Bradyrhizobium sp.]|uniref:hypothetical protein n=1 Tax=Bradyrhizobium sp. TaxID=376 RepID=UPI003C5D1973